MDKGKIGERIKFVRKELGMTQDKFGSEIGVKGNTVTGYERGSRNPSNSVINMICLVFEVNQTWLRTGEGDDVFIHKSPKLGSLNELYSDFDCNALERSFLDSYFNLKKRERYAFCAMLKKMFPALSEVIGSDPLVPTWQDSEKTEKQSVQIDIAELLQKPVSEMTDAEVQALKEEINREIDAEKEAEEKSLDSSTATGKGNVKKESEAS